MNLFSRLIEKHRFFRIARECGWSAAWTIFIGERFGKEFYSVKIRGVPNRVYLRPRTSDVGVLMQIFALHEMKINLKQSPESILDAGANIGLSAIALSLQFPNAEIIALEPDQENYICCCKNTSFYPHIRVMKSALWKEDGFVSLANPHGDAWARKMEEVSSEKEKIKAYSIRTISKEFKNQTIDFLKLDIEGSEKELFDRSEEWIMKVGCIIVELHEGIAPGCDASFRNVCEQMKSNFQPLGEKFFVINSFYAGFSKDSL